MSPKAHSICWQGRKYYWSAFRRTEYRVIDETLVIWDKTSSNVLCHVIFVKGQGLAYTWFSGSCLLISISLFVGVGGEIVKWTVAIIRWATSLSIGWEFWNLFLPCLK
jgi:hypothetical protein